jgi:glucose-1-phosphate cytidylyltransferase
LTYGDGVSDVDITRLIDFHKTQRALATVTAVQPPGRFGSFSLEKRKMKISSFLEKPQGDGAWINGGYFVLEPSAIDYIDDDMTIWEQGPLQNLARDGMLAAYRHQGFWQCMDTQHDKAILEKLWASGKPPWKVWE